MASLLQQFKQLKSNWRAVCQTKNHKKITSFFDSNKKDILSSDGASAWFLYDLISNQLIDSMKYIFQRCDAQKYTNHMGLHYISQCGTLEMAKLVVSIGIDGIHPDHGSVNVGSLICNLLEHNHCIAADETYLFIEYLLRNLNNNISYQYSDRIMNALAASKKHGFEFDPVKILKIIESKTTLNASQSPSGTARSSVARKNYKFAQYFIEEYDAKISPSLYKHECVDKEIIEWLLTHNVDINGDMSQSNKITPLFQCCIDKQYAKMELLLDYGADINRKCVYKEKELTVLQFCENTLENKYFKYFKNYQAKNCDNKQNKTLGINLSNIPTTPYDEQLLLLKNEDNISLLNSLNAEQIKEREEISKLENELKLKYETLQSLIIKQYEVEDKKENVSKWIKGQNIWIEFLSKWKNWNIFCCIEYLKRMKYAEKSYNEYYLNDNECKQKIENYIKNSFVEETKEGDMSIDKKIYFTGDYLLYFTKQSMNDIGITHRNDIECIYSSLQALIKNNKDINKKNDDFLNAKQDIVEIFLNKVNLSQYSNIFKNEGYENLDDLKYIKEDDLRKIGINKQAHIARILRHIKELNEPLITNYIQ